MRVAPFTAREAIAAIRPTDLVDAALTALAVAGMVLGLALLIT